MTILPTKKNVDNIVKTLARYHGRKLTEEQLTDLLFEAYNKSGERKATKDGFRTTYRVVFHSWCLYKKSNHDRFHLTPLGLEYFHDSIDYITLMRTICARWQYPKPQTFRQPEGVLKPMVELMNALNKLHQKTGMKTLSLAEMNLFCCVMKSNEDTELYVKMVESWRDKSWSPPKELNQKSLMNPIEGMFTLLKYADCMVNEGREGPYGLC